MIELNTKTVTVRPLLRTRKLWITMVRNGFRLCSGSWVYRLTNFGNINMPQTQYTVSAYYNKCIRLSSISSMHFKQIGWLKSTQVILYKQQFNGNVAVIQ